jgi:hypothetical protein
MRVMHLLDEDDVITGTEWIRNVQFDHGYHENDFSQYSGHPVNCTKWVPILDVIGHCWIGRKLSEVTAGLVRRSKDKGPYYEVSRDKPDDAYCWDWRESKKKIEFAVSEY